jgi:hypothetical protein
MISLPLNAALGFIMIVTLCYCTVDIDAVLESPVGMAGYPYIQIFYNSTQSKGAATIMTILPLISLTGSVTAEIATASRQLWSFSRDGGVPFYRYVSAVSIFPEGAQKRLTKSAGQHEMGDSLECVANLPRNQPPSATHQHRINGRHQCHFLAQRSQYPDLIHHLHRLSALEAPSRRTASSSQVDARALGHLLQRRIAHISVSACYLPVLPAHYTRYSTEHELWQPDVGIYDHFLNGLLLLVRPEAVHASRVQSAQGHLKNCTIVTRRLKTASKTDHSRPTNTYKQTAKCLYFN